MWSQAIVCLKVSLVSLSNEVVVIFCYCTSSHLLKVAYFIFLWYLENLVWRMCVVTLFVLYLGHLVLEDKINKLTLLSDISLLKPEHACLWL